MRRIKLMADYDCYPLWDSDAIGNLNPAALPLSRGLRDALHGWAAAFNATLNRDDPASSGFASPQAEHAFDTKGRELWRDLQRELGPDYKISYFSGTERRVLEPGTERA